MSSSYSKADPVDHTTPKKCTCLCTWSVLVLAGLVAILALACAGITLAFSAKSAVERQGSEVERQGSEVERLRSEVASLNSSEFRLNETTLALLGLSQAVGQQMVTVGYFQRLISQLYPVSFCSALLTQWPFSPSGYYWVSPTDDGSMTRVYCDMNSTCGSGGWMRVTSLDWRDSASDCPEGFSERIDDGIRTCGISSRTGSCMHTILDTS